MKSYVLEQTMDNLKSSCQYVRPYLPFLVAGGAVIATGVAVYRVSRTLRRKTGVGKMTAPPDTAIIYQMKRGPYAPSLSPFPLKLETYCRFAKIPYVVDKTGRFSSRGKIPWMTYNGEIVEDSQFCIEYFNKKLGVDLNSHLSVEERAVSRFIQILVDEHLYWALVMYRWVFSPPSYIYKHLGFTSAKFRIFQRYVQNQAHGQGIGRHSEEEIRGIAMEDLGRLSDFLGNKPFLFGEEICEADCSAFGMLAQIVWHPSEEGKTILLEDKFPTLHQYCLRIKEKVWPDWEECCKN